LFVLSVVRAATATDDVAVQIRTLQRERVAELTKLVEILESQYRVGTIDCEAIIVEEVGLVDAQADATDKPESSVAILAEALTRQRETLKYVEHVDFTPMQDDIAWWRAVSLETQIRLLNAQKNVSTDIESLQKERVKALTNLVAITMARYKVGTVDCNAVLLAQVALLNAQVVATKNRAERLSLLTEDVKNETRFLNDVQERVKKGTTDRIDATRANALILATKITLLRESGNQEGMVAEIKALTGERIEVLSKLAESDAANYSAKATSFELAISSEAELTTAQLDATDKREKRTALLSEALSRETALLKLAESKFAAGKVSQADVYRARSLLLHTRIWLLQNGGSQTVRTK